ncbi:hypothetical protein GCM10011366_24230 [Ornithinimicrobium tianjinense]|uniref:Uncharacterized protein n=1 Tax=Ornithinimicrobium tianjinense TaxID=1195761 RepID=A0A917F6D4_9MICO|nr:hypothetical protein GCM10011366_24230 [Ornithinimicrobium tianjinense]
MPGLRPARLSRQEEELLASVPMLGMAWDALRVQRTRTVRHLIPDGFPAIARVFHPPSEEGAFKDLYSAHSSVRFGRHSRWADIYHKVSESQLPNEGSAPVATLSAIVDHMRTEEESGFLYAVWEGFGFWDHQAGRDEEPRRTSAGPFYIFQSEISFGPWPGHDKDIHSRRRMPLSP